MAYAKAPSDTIQTSRRWIFYREEKPKMDPEQVQEKFQQVLDIENRIWSYQNSLKAINKVLESNEAKLNDSLIHIPLLKKTILDDMGIFKKDVPYLLDENLRIVTTYNKLLDEMNQLKDIKLEILDQISRAILQDPDSYKPEEVEASKCYVDNMNEYKRNLNTLEAK